MQSKFLLVVIGVVLLATHSYQSPVGNDNPPVEGDSANHDNPAGQPPAGQPPADQPPAGQPPAGQPPADQNPAGQPPAPENQDPAPGNPPAEVGHPLQAGGEDGGVSGTSTQSPGNGDDDAFVPPVSMAQ
ncbi:hypothetical protein DdX_06559 [Ditylenchus destructor]|uniref:Uncharacterized protein n=1 Tax=Ditylenchus destructor TaxID=166010 RepID=A0AAD4R2L4_9BILA|nr:hypothetical protein DdX_06559 [Ditylenchus destructor]